MTKPLRGATHFCADPATVVEQAYASACKNAASETSISVDAFPKQCPFSLEEVLSEAFLPEANG